MQKLLDVLPHIVLRIQLTLTNLIRYYRNAPAPVSALLRLRELALGDIYLVAVQLVNVGHHLGALDRQQDEARRHLRR